MNHDDFLGTAFIAGFDPVPIYQSQLDDLEIFIDQNTKKHVAIYNGKAYKIETKLDGNGKEEIIVDGRSFEVQIKRPVDLLTDKMGFGKRKSADQKIILAPMPGNVLHVEVSVGQEVKKGDAILTLEAMKMENAVQSSLDGIIKKVHVNQGQKVTKGEKLIELE